MAKKFLVSNLLFYATAVAMTCYLTWRTLFTLPFGYGWPSLIVGLTLLICEIVAFLETIEQYMNWVYANRLELPDIPHDWFPDVDIFITTHNEEVDLLFKTVNAANYLEYPDKSKVHVYICDDNNRPEMRELADRMGVGYYGLSDNKQAKAGNFNNALFQSNSTLVATFDADMIPRRNFLLRTAPYFSLPKLKKDKDGRWVPRLPEEIDPNEKIGFIQTPQSFYNADLFQFNLHAESRLPNEQDYFFREINVGRNRANSTIFAGSNALISREALLKVGGMAIDTLTEDFETGMRIQQEGYKTYAVNDTLTHGLAPHTIKSLLAQRERWARGCVQSLKNVKPFFSSRFSLAAKVTLMATVVYWWTFLRRFFYIIVPILSALFDLRVVICSLWQILLMWLPSYYLTNKTLTVLSGRTRNFHWSNAIDTILFPYLIGPMFMETLGFKKKVFDVTKKKKEKGSTNTLILALPHLFLLATSVVAIGVCFNESLEYRRFYNVIILFWLLVNAKNLILALFFMMGRYNYRHNDRFKAELPVEAEYHGHKYTGQTTDISDDGLAITLSFPAFLPDDEPFILRVKDLFYRAELSCVVAHVDPRSGQTWRYSLKVVDVDERNRREYAQIVHDRPHSLPLIISESQTALDDFRNNLEKRLWDEKRVPAIRRLPRLILDVAAQDPQGRTVIVADFNYKYALVHGNWEPPVETELEIAPQTRLKLQLVEGQRKKPDKNGALYQVLNWAELLADQEFDSWLRKALQSSTSETSTLAVAPAFKIDINKPKLKVN